MSKLKVGSRIRLWPKDTYAKFGVVKSITGNQVIVEITEKDPRDPTRYKIGDIINFPLNRLIVFNEQEYRGKYC